jgi:hypothetical protein
MVSIDEELKVARQAQIAIEMLSTRPEAAIGILRNAKDVAGHGMIIILSGEELLNAARHKVAIALPDLINGPLTRESIDAAKGAIEAWVKLLEAQVGQIGTQG